MKIAPQGLREGPWASPPPPLCGSVANHSDSKSAITVEWPQATDIWAQDTAAGPGLLWPGLTCPLTSGIGCSAGRSGARSLSGGGCEARSGTGRICTALPAAPRTGTLCWAQSPRKWSCRNSGG